MCVCVCLVVLQETGRLVLSPARFQLVLLYSRKEGGEMIKLFSVKEKQKADAAAAAAGVTKQSPGELRLAKDLSELNLPPRTLSMSFPGSSKSGGYIDV